MIKEPIKKDISQLQQDKPADQVKLMNSALKVEPVVVKKPALIEDTKEPFFRYPSNGLYGLL